MQSQNPGRVEAMELECNGLKAEIPVPTNLFTTAANLKHDFSQVLASDELAADLPDSVPELVAHFLSFVSAFRTLPSVSQLLRHWWKFYDNEVLGGNDIHVFAATSYPDEQTRQDMIRLYYSARRSSEIPLRNNQSALFRAQAEEQARIHAIFGGQGNTKTYFEELRQVYSTYKPLVQDLITSLGSLLRELSRDERVRDQFYQGLDILHWLENPESTPSAEYLISAPLSFPLIGVLQLSYLQAVCHSLGASPEEFPSMFHGLSGHSQGVVVAAATATATTWPEFQEAAVKAVSILFWIGARSQQTFRETPLPPTKAEILIQNGLGTPSPMLSVSNISTKELSVYMGNVNKFLAEDERVYIGLINSHNSFVVSGPERSLAALSDLMQSKGAAGNQARVPFSERKSAPAVRFLPVTAPFHCSILNRAIPLIEEDLRDIHISPASLKVPVNRSDDGEDLNSRATQDLVPDLVRMVTAQPVHWDSAAFPSATHIIDFGPGGASGVGALTQRNSAGSGARVIVAGCLTSPSSSSDLGARLELFDRAPSSIRWAKNWARAHAPSLVRTAAGTTTVDSKLSRLLGLPPFMVAGMTPTTTHPDFVAACMRAGYHAELAGGGYRNAQEMAAALEDLRAQMPRGRKITVNVIYINPRAIAWQIPLVRRLRAEGFPIAGLAVGGGVPSADVATEYIDTLGLEHISFKPGSAEAIGQVVEIARRNPGFPVILQWTGGRGGGHHSFEDFHQPILETYQDIRQCDNIVLVGGSGFGAADDVYPYLTGEWSTKGYKRAAMPFDGFLFGSRVMTCKEAHTSPGVKAAIVAAEGVADGEWERALKGPAGGVVSVTSEMGEPIHVLATRGALFWAEMDHTVFSLDKQKRAKVLEAKKDYIVQRLNRDFQKVWFGQKGDGSQQACDLADMTYAEVLHRMVQLMFVEHQQRWIDDSYRKLLLDFLVRTEERFAPADDLDSMISDADAVDQPQQAIEELLQAYPDAREELLGMEDVHYFLQICRRPSHKPVPFVPALDQHFETWFKKDSLWQSEDLDAVPDRDAGRTFVLQGPVAIRHCQQVDESVQQVMDSINNGTISKLLHEQYGGDESAIRYEEYVKSSNHDNSASMVDSSHLPRREDVNVIDIRSLEPNQLLSLLAGCVSSWRHALFMHHDFVQERNLVENPMPRMISSVDADMVEILDLSHIDVDHSMIRLLKELPSGQRKVLMQFEKTGREITVQLFTWVVQNDVPASLVLKYEYHPEAPYAPIWEVMSDRNHRVYDFYRELWLGQSVPAAQPDQPTSSPESTVFEDSVVMDEAHARLFSQAVGYDKAYKDEHVPMDLGIVLSWKPVSQALLQDPVQGDLLKLVHLSNAFELAADARPLELREKVRATARVSSITIEDSGKVVEIACKLARDDAEVMTVTSRFLFRGVFEDFSSTFARISEEPLVMTPASVKEVEALTSKPWFRLLDARANLLDTELVFHLSTSKRYKSRAVYSNVETTGEVFSRLASDGKLTQVGSIDYHAGECRGNPVTAFLSRYGKPLTEIHQLNAPVPLVPNGCTITIPTTNEAYSRASGDFNPIHTSPVFAAYVNLPGTITHGMYCSAAVRQVVESYAAAQTPERVRKYTASFVGMVLPGDTLDVSLHHTSMLNGLQVVKIEARKTETGEKVLEGEAHISQPRTAIVFTGQGSQEKGMGMDLYETSSVARAIWDKADAYFEAQFGLRITDVVRRNPQEIKIHFGGVRGRMLRQNYMDMKYDVPIPGTTRMEQKRMFPEISAHTTSYTHRCPKGLLFATQFAQPALTIMEVACFKDMQARGVVPEDCCFAGHSLGEYSALAAITDFMPFERLLYIVFCRGLTMQAAVERDALNRSSFGMVAVDPSRVSKGKTTSAQSILKDWLLMECTIAFTDEALRELVSTLSTTTGLFLEIVNFNVRGQQYVCAGDLRALDCLQRVVDELKSTANPSPSSLPALIARHAQAYAHVAASTIELKRGAATVPLPGVDVPFHSSWLVPRMQPFRQVLLDNLERGRIDPRRLVGKYVPNVTGEPFALSREYFKKVLARTGSAQVREVVDRWDEHWGPRVRGERMGVVGA